jgi:hypothetical protein
LRRSNHLLHQRAEWYAPIQHTASQYNLGEPGGRLAKPQNRLGLIARFAHACVQQNMAVETALVDCHDPLFAELERSIEKTAHSHDPLAVALLRAIPGVGTILAEVLRYASEESAGSPRVQAFVTDCRPVKSAQECQGV